ncbi:lactonase family protein [Mycetocola tolaasinivorans]|uniref:Lactonase family protein n=1 Tax=Mycetocola tolaasinivorans TaxID=76635 RepID=A0A3L7A2X7_9MICO|nr:beta-propeller fold lactonase family protein [Mycetocola tolaasinivorans]RLP74537.1 lactonase family protein [Mycetocola tolaasinivorans]
MSDSRFWVGSYTADAQAPGVGITALGSRPDGSLAGAGETPADSPSFLTAHPTLPVIYAALEHSGLVQAYHARARAVRFGPARASAASVCHLTVTADGALLVATGYGDGRVLAYPLGPDGAILADAAEPPASIDPHRSPFTGGELTGGPGPSSFTDLSLASHVAEAAPARDSHAHASVELPDGRILTTDLGHDALRFWRRTGSGLALDRTLALPLGVGPRHLITHPSGHVHVVTERSIEIFTLAPADAGNWRVVAAAPATADGAEERDAAAEISRSAAGDRLYVGVRGSDRIVTLDVSGNGQTLRPIADTESGGRWPRHHLLAGDLLHVAHEHSHAITTLRLDARGVPGRPIGIAEIGAPTCILADPVATPV